MNVTKNGITVSIPDAEVLRMVLERLNDEPKIISPSVNLTMVPRIGEVWSDQGGIYAGIARGRDAAPDYHLIVGPEFDGQIDWVRSDKWATGLQLHGFSDYRLGYLKELALAFANVPELFKKESYWSCERHASDSYDAWGQDFSSGTQGYWYKDTTLRARAFRRLLIQ